MMVSANVVAALGVRRQFVYYMEPFKPLACLLSREWLKLLRIGINGVRASVCI